MTDVAALSDEELQRIAGGGDLSHLSDEELQALAGQPETKASGYSALDLLAPWEGGLHVGSGMLAGPVSGLAGLASMPFKGGEGAADVVRNVQDAMTYQPRGKAAGQMGELQDKLLSLPAQAGDWAGGKVTDVSSGAMPKGAGPATLGTLTNIGVQAIPAVLGSRAHASLRASAADTATQRAMSNDLARRAVDAGYKIPPSEMAQSGAGRAVLQQLEGLGGKAAMQQDASIANNRIVGEGTRRQGQIPGEGQITAEDMDAARDPHLAVYEEARGLSQRANAAVEAWRRANFEAKRQRAFYERSMNPEAQDAAQAAQREANHHMAVLEAEATRLGNVGLADRLRGARVSLGRLGTIDNARNTATGEVSAQDLKRARDRGVPVNGEMGLAADMSEAFRGKLTQPQVIQPGVSRLDSAVAAAAAALKGPKALALTGLPYLTRRLLLSDAVQQSMRPPNHPAVRLTPMQQAQTTALIAALQKQQENQ